LVRARHLAMSGSTGIREVVSLAIPQWPPAPAGENADIIPQLTRRQADHLDQPASKDGEIDPENFPQQRFPPDVVAEPVRTDKQQALRCWMPESNRSRIAGPEQGLAHLTPCEVVDVVIFEKPRLTVSHAGADNSLRGPSDADARGFAGAHPIVGLPQEVAPRRFIVLQRCGARHLSNHRVGGLAPAPVPPAPSATIITTPSSNSITLTRSSQRCW